MLRRKGERAMRARRWDADSGMRGGADRRVTPIDVLAALPLAATAIALLGCATTNDATLANTEGCTRPHGYIDPSSSPPALGGYPPPPIAPNGTPRYTNPLPLSALGMCAWIDQFPSDHPIRTMLLERCPAPAPETSASTPPVASASAAATSPVEPVR